MMLEIKNVTKSFGGLVAVNDFTANIEENEIVALIGPNGAGKTTLFNVICGIYSPDHGTIKFRGKDIAGLKPHAVCKLGLVKTEQIPRNFPNLTVFENVLVGAFFGKSQFHSSDAKKKVVECLDFVGLSDYDVLARNLSYPDSKKLGLAIALATSPSLILMDEVMAGLNPTEILEMMELVKNIRGKLGITVFWIEHVMKAVMEISDKVIVMSSGKKIAEGKPKNIAKDRKVIEAYLGEVYA